MGTDLRFIVPTAGTPFLGAPADNRIAQPGVGHVLLSGASPAVSSGSPLLSAATGISVNTTGTDGDIYYVRTTSINQPTSSQIQAGTDHNDSAAADSGSYAVLAAQGVVIPVTANLATITDYYSHYVHVAADTSESNVVTSSSYQYDGFFTDGGYAETFNWLGEGSQNGLDPSFPTPLENIIPPGSEIGGLDGVIQPLGGKYVRVQNAASQPFSNGASGVRFWVGPAKNMLAGKISMNTDPLNPQEVWLRWYQRWEAGAEWSGSGPGYEKNYYIYPTPNPNGNADSIIPGYGGGSFYFSNGDSIFAFDTEPVLNWSTIVGNPSNGNWFLNEVHMKTETSPAANDGILQYWINGVRRLNRFDIDFEGACSGFAVYVFESNQEVMLNANEVACDYDDIALFTSTPPNTSPDGDPWIGPVNGYTGG